MTSELFRKRIAAEVFKSNSATLIYDCEGKLTDYAKPTFVADRIIEIVREAAIEELCAEYGDDGEGIKVRLNRALDAAFGADDDGGERQHPRLPPVRWQQETALDRMAHDRRVSMTSKAQQFADDVKNLAALDGDADDWEAGTSPWSPVNQVVAMACMRLDELAETEGMTDDEARLAKTAAGTIHAVCVVLEELQESWFERHEGADDIRIRLRNDS